MYHSGIGAGAVAVGALAVPVPHTGNTSGALALLYSVSVHPFLGAFLAVALFVLMVSVYFAVRQARIRGRFGA
jgi:hypothetical protein